MIARSIPSARARARRRGILHRWFVWWRTLLTRALGAAPAVTRAGVAGPADPSRAHHPSGLRGLRGAAARWLGPAAVIVGAAAGAFLAAAGTDRRAALLGGGASLAWMIVRGMLLSRSARGLGVADPASVRRALGLGLLAYAAAVTPELRLVAWAVSGAVTWLVLQRAGARRSDALRIVGFAWGFQGVVVVGSWLARNALMGLLLVRG